MFNAILNYLYRFAFWRFKKRMTFTGWTGWYYCTKCYCNVWHIGLIAHKGVCDKVRKL